MLLVDLAAERGVLAGICSFGSDAYFDVADIVSEKTFTDDANGIIFACLKHIIEGDATSKIDASTIYSAARALEVDYLFKQNEEVKHLQALMSMPVALPNVRKHAAVIRKLEITRLLHAQLGAAQEKLLEVKGHEPINTILSIAEDTVFDFTSLINNARDEDPTTISDGLTEFLQYLVDNPRQQVGLSSGWAKYDAAIGGGFRNGTVSVLAARMKVGKSTFSINVANHISKNVGVPVLYLDTEMMKPEQTYRIMAMLTETPIDDIETGKFAEDYFVKKKLFDMATSLKDGKIPFYYKDIAGRPFEEILSIARRWIVKHVGLNDDGTAKPCIIIYDYLKLMSGDGLDNDLKEYQILGFMMTGWVNFAKRYNIPVLTLAQLNKDGITKETTDIVGGSDRIAMYCANLSILKYKSDDEIKDSGLDEGNRKLVVLVARHGPGMEGGDYINMKMIGKYAKIVEGKTAFEQGKDDEGFIVDGEFNGEVPFDG